MLAKLGTVDGAGSGVDADLFHGQGPGFFTDIIARLGFTPANAAHFGFNADAIGHYLLPGGFALNWGTSGILASDGQQAIALSQPVSVHLAAVCVPNAPNANVDNHGIMVNPPIGLPATSLTVGRGFITGGGGGSGTVTFIAIGQV